MDLSLLKMLPWSQSSWSGSHCLILASLTGISRITFLVTRGSKSSLPQARS